MPGEITFGGLATGLDTSAIINQLMSLERQPIYRLEDKQKTYETQASRWRGVQSKLNALTDKMGALGERDDVLSNTVSSSDEKVFTATSLGGAPLGPTEVHVTSLAAAQRTYSDAFGAADTAGLFGSGTLTITAGSDDPVDVTIEATDTLESVVDKINASGADVSAGILFDGTNYRLRVSGNETGAANAVTFGEAGTTLGLTNPANEVQAAADAVFTLDGFAMTRSANSFSDAIDGVKITLTGASPTADPAVLDVERDPDSLREKVDAFVKAYNDVMGGINGEFAYTGQPKDESSLAGDSTLRSLQSRMRARVASAVPGISGSKYTTLASIGVESGNDGTLTLDTAKLEAALDDDPNAVADLFAGNGSTVTGFAELFEADLELFTDDTDGVIKGRIDGLEGRSKDIDDQIDRLELRLDQTEARLTQQYAQLEQVVSGLQNQGNQILSVLSGL